ncbi:unnamed protein product [Trichogramma brassicae]|uniref:Uncharacterized protein n=1 Tax=Trichogramma brassicae TaxID=86971 RepID=A0A6H5I1W0_9HYME|nr:unnamed protein product [Trichogramma brassicae]
MRAELLPPTNPHTYAHSNTYISKEAPVYNSELAIMPTLIIFNHRMQKCAACCDRHDHSRLAYRCVYRVHNSELDASSGVRFVRTQTNAIIRQEDNLSAIARDLGALIRTRLQRVSHSQTGLRTKKSKLTLHFGTTAAAAATQEEGGGGIRLYMPTLMRRFASICRRDALLYTLANAARNNAVSRGPRAMTMEHLCSRAVCKDQPLRHCFAPLMCTKRRSSYRLRGFEHLELHVYLETKKPLYRGGDLERAEQKARKPSPTPTAILGTIAHAKRRYIRKKVSLLSVYIYSGERCARAPSPLQALLRRRCLIKKERDVSLVRGISVYSSHTHTDTRTSKLEPYGYIYARGKSSPPLARTRPRTTRVLYIPSSVWRGLRRSVKRQTIRTLGVYSAL